MLKVKLLILFLLLSGLSLLARLPMTDIDTESGEIKADTVSVKLLNHQCWSLRRADPLSAIAIGKQALEMARNIGYNKGEAQILNYLGICYLRLNDSPTATDYFYKALQFSDSLNISVEKGYALNNIASSLLAEGENRQALIFARKALSLQTLNNDTKGIAYAYVRLCDVYNNLQQYDSLLVAAQTAFRLLQDLGMTENSLIAMKSIGHAWEGKHQYAKALSCYMQVVNSVSISPVTARNVDADLARVYNLLNLPDKAIFYGKLWLSTEKINDLILRQMAKAYALKEDWKEAFRYARMSLAVMDSVAKEEKLSQIKNLQILYVTREKEKENAVLKVKLNNKNLFVSAFAVILILICALVIILLSKRSQQSRLNKLLNQKNQEILVQRDHLDELNQTKNKLFSIIAHDLRGPIGSTSTFLELLTTHESEFSKQEILDNLILIRDSSNATFRLLENLLTWARAQKGEIEFSPQKNNLFKLVQSNIELFASNTENKKIQIVNEIQPELIFEFDLDMINTVMRNLINNAIKYTNEDGLITISAKEFEDNIEICVEDNGIGMESDNAELLFITDLKRNRKEGTKGEKGTGLGLILCRDFVTKHNGNIWAESELGIGSTFKFKLPRGHQKEEFDYNNR